jgi:ketosteroid isomerase-like protein
MQRDSDWLPGGAAWPRLFAAIAARDAALFAGFFTPDGEFRFGNGPAVVGRDAVRAAVAEFFAAIGGCSHRLLRSWHAPGTVACEGEVTYLRLDGARVTVPFANVLALHDGAIASYRIYIDNAPLWAPRPR